ncbi:VanZ family protein [Marinicrinis sediminis]|uniref:VanZ family protein n=1 Tax=Marinicrinis sediminis TaxID=1652465 RepID=A0ABW5RFK6_9BACL
MVYLIPIQYALMVFPFAAFLFSLPFLFYQYYTYGYINRIRAFVLYALVLYVLTAYFLVILPLPDTRDTCSTLSTDRLLLQTDMFHFISVISPHFEGSPTDPATYLRLVTEPTFLQVFFNICLLVPFGMLLRYYFRRKWLRTAAFSFVLSLFFELSQLSGLYGIYHCPYRLFDVDDLLMNTLGGVLGYWLAPVLTRFLPDTRTLDEDVDLDTYPVGFVRRFLAFLIDAVVLSMPSAALLYMQQAPLILLLFALYFIVLNYGTNGSTVGKRWLRIQLHGPEAHLSWKGLCIRYGLIFGVWGGSHVPLLIYDLADWPVPFTILYLSILFLMNVVVVIDLLSRIYRPKKRMLYEKLSGTSYRIRS